MGFPAPSVSYGLFSRRICKINPTDMLRHSMLGYVELLKVLIIRQEKTAGTRNLAS